MLPLRAVRTRRGRGVGGSACRAAVRLRLSRAVPGTRRGVGSRAIPHAFSRHARGDGGGGMPSPWVRRLCAGPVRRIRARTRLFAALALACGAADHHGVGQRAWARPGDPVPGLAGLPATGTRLATDRPYRSRRRVQRHDVRGGTGQRRSAGVRDGDARGQAARDRLRDFTAGRHAEILPDRAAGSGGARARGDLPGDLGRVARRHCAVVRARRRRDPARHGEHSVNASVRRQRVRRTQSCLRPGRKNRPATPMGIRAASVPSGCRALRRGVAGARREVAHADRGGANLSAGRKRPAGELLRSGTERVIPRDTPAFRAARAGCVLPWRGMAGRAADVEQRTAAIDLRHRSLAFRHLAGARVGVVGGDHAARDIAVAADAAGTGGCRIVPSATTNKRFLAAPRVLRE